MDGQEHEFWSALTAPFASDSYQTRKGKAGKTFTYLDSRVIENRLDDVAGPANWDTEYRETSRGVICSLTIKAPTRGVWIPVVRGGAGGFRVLDDEDSTYKSAFTSAFRSAASRFGIGRELYGKGMPSYCAALHNTRASGLPQKGPGAGAPPALTEEDRAGQAAPASPRSNGSGKYENQPPFGRAGTKAPYAWAMACGKHFFGDGDAYAVLNFMGEYAKTRKKPSRTDQWDDGFLDECLTKTVAWIRGLENYHGEFGAGTQPDAPGGGAAAPSDTGALKKAIWGAAVALLTKKFAREPSTVEVAAAIGEMASSVPNGQGHRGEVLESLKTCGDKAWLTGILKSANKAISDAAQEDAGHGPMEDDDDIPF